MRKSLNIALKAVSKLVQLINILLTIKNTRSIQEQWDIKISYASFLSSKQLQNLEIMPKK